jgi:hemoglobin
MTSLFEQLGGEAAIGSVVDKFYEHMLKDPVVNYYFANTDMAKQIQSQKEFIILVTGGPCNYSGKDMKTAHQKFKIGKK